MRLLALALIAGLSAVGGCQSRPAEQPWLTSPPAAAAEEEAPRNEYYKPGGTTAVMPDTVTHADPDWRPTGTVFFGPKDASGAPPGASHSAAFKDFDCPNDGESDNPQCIIVVEAGAILPAAIPPQAQHEFLDIQIQKFENGTLTAHPAATATVRGTESPRNHRLVVQGCGRVRLTLSTREDGPSPENPPGIQTKFRARIVSHGCPKP
jgi:hypothetical protein